MDLKKPDRATLKSYFVKNAMPTAANFADLVDGALNQKDDGIAKLPGEPLSLLAEGDDASMKKAINFYRKFTDQNPDWTLCLNPRVNPTDQNTAKPGWSISTADGRSRFFIDQTTGNIGIGSVAPTSALHLRKDASGSLGPVLGIMNGGGGKGASAAIDFSSYDTTGQKPTVRIESVDDGSASSHLIFSVKEIGASSNSLVEALRIASNRNVGIGLTEPVCKLEVVGTVAISNGNRDVAIAGKMASGSLSIGSTVSSYGGGNGWNSNIAALVLETSANTEIAVHEKEKRLASLLYYEGGAINRITIGRNMGFGLSQVKVPGVLAVDSVHAGSMGIGTTNPTHKFHVVAEEAVGLLESSRKTAYLRISTSDGLDNRVEICNRGDGRLALWTAGPGSGKPGEDVLNITKEGNVGIGTSTPSHKFHVKTGDAVGLFESSGTQAYLRIYANDGEANRVEVCNRGGGRLGLWTNGGPKDALTILKNGNVGIGTEDPKARLHVCGGDMKHEGRHVTTASERMCIVQGLVELTTDDDIKTMKNSGSGYSVSATTDAKGNRCFKVAFNPIFQNRPSVMATVLRPWGNSPQDNVVLDEVKNESVVIYVGYGSTYRHNSFSFIAIGQVA